MVPMIDPANDLLRDLIQSRIPALGGITQVDFEPPNDEWRQSVVASGEERVNLYLYDVRENLKLFTNERVREPRDGYVIETKAPPRLDCHYLVTAWSPVTFAPPMVEPTRDEHARLYEVLALLMQNRPLYPADVYAAGPVNGHTLDSVPPELQPELPIDVSLPDAMKNLGDFWTTMKVAWRPAVQLTVTVPIVPGDPGREFPEVTTVTTDYRQTGAGAGDPVLAVGGRVLAGTPTPEVVKGAWVQIQGIEPSSTLPINRRMVSDAAGRFRFSRLLPGKYRIRAVAVGHDDIKLEVTLPSESGEYDMRFP
jgi:hypothetical protein